MGEHVIVGMSDVYVAEEPVVLRTNLGSCVAVCLYAAQKKVGGMLHFMLASSKDAHQPITKPEKYADTGMDKLLTILKRKFGVEAKDLYAKIFGGAKVLRACSFNIGECNQQAIVALLAEKNIKIKARQTGGAKGYKIEFNLSTGKVMCQIFGSKEEEC